MAFYLANQQPYMSSTMAAQDAPVNAALATKAVRLGIWAALSIIFECFQEVVRPVGVRSAQSALGTRRR